MICNLTTTTPDGAFWERYGQLWENSLHRSPFQSPHILQYFASLVQDRLGVFECTHEGILMAAAVFKQENGHYTFLSDMKTDANFFILHRDCSPEMTRGIFKHFLDAIQQRKWALMLNHKPAWAGYMAVFEELIRSSSLYSMQIDYSVCPIAVGESPEALFKEVSSSRNTRYKVNKLIKQENGVFEVCTDDTCIDHWVEEFCDAHVKRWAPTPTPSSYRFPVRRAFLKACLHAWHADGVLVRFALKVDESRIGFVVGLIEGETLIYHAPTYLPDYSHCSPGRTLIYFITQWMSENNYRVLDFGDGNEAYKYYVASEEKVLRRIFISPKNNLMFIAKTQMIRAIRNNKQAYQVYQNKLKPAFRRLRQRVAAIFSYTCFLDGVNQLLLEDQLLCFCTIV